MSLTYAARGLRGRFSHAVAVEKAVRASGKHLIFIGRHGSGHSGPTLLANPLRAPDTVVVGP